MDFDARRAYFDDYVDTIEVVPPSLEQYRMRYTCPRCGYPTLLEPGPDGTCALCSGEDDANVKADIMAAFDAMQTTPMCEHEPLWAAVLTGMEKLRPPR